MWGCIGIAAAGAGIAAAAGAGVAASFGPAAAAVKPSVSKSVAVINTLKNPIFFIAFLLVRIPARTPPVTSIASDSLSRARPRHPHSIVARWHNSSTPQLTLKVLAGAWFQNGPVTRPYAPSRFL